MRDIFHFGVRILVSSIFFVGGCRSHNKDSSVDKTKDTQSAPDTTVNAGRSQVGGGSVDTTKDVYTDEEAPSYQVQVLNGVETQVPWDQVPEGSRWFYVQEHGVIKTRVPVVRDEITSVDRSGHPVPVKDGYEINGIKYELNPKYVMTTYYGNAH